MVNARIMSRNRKDWAKLVTETKKYIIYVKENVYVSENPSTAKA